MATLTVYPSPGVTVDGTALRGVDPTIGEAWGTIRDGAGTAVQTSSSATEVIRIRSSDVSGWRFLMRAIYLFDTSALTSGATITAGVMSIYGQSKTDNLAVTPNLNVYTSTPASDTTLANGDYSQIGTTAQCDTPVTYAGFNTGGYNDFSFNATGLGNISKTGISKFGIRNANYDVANSAPTFTAGTASFFEAYFSDNAGTTNDPKLVITYSTSTNYPITASVGAFTLTGVTTLLKVGRKMVSALGTFTLSGQTAILRWGRKMVAGLGTFVLTGQNVIFLLGKVLVAGLGTFTLSGQNILFHVTLSILAGLGMFTLTGQTVLLKVGRKITAGLGTFTLTGISVVLSAGRYIVSSLGTFTLTGQTITFKLARMMVAGLGSFVLSGQTVLFAVNGIYVKWLNSVKNTSTFSNISKAVSSWINNDKTL